MKEKKYLKNFDDDGHDIPFIITEYPHTIVWCTTHCFWDSVLMVHMFDKMRNSLGLSELRYQNERTQCYILGTVQWIFWVTGAMSPSMCSHTLWVPAAWWRLWCSTPSSSASHQETFESKQNISEYQSYTIYNEWILPKWPVLTHVQAGVWSLELLW